jgi:hypothetical protein
VERRTVPAVSPFAGYVVAGMLDPRWLLEIELEAFVAD